MLNRHTSLLSSTETVIFLCSFLNSSWLLVIILEASKFAQICEKNTKIYSVKINPTSWSHDTAYFCLFSATVETLWLPCVHGQCGTVERTWLNQQVSLWLKQKKLEQDFDWKKMLFTVTCELLGMDTKKRDWWLVFFPRLSDILIRSLKDYS